MHITITVPSYDQKSWCVDEVEIPLYLVASFAHGRCKEYLPLAYQPPTISLKHVQDFFIRRLLSHDLFLCILTSQRSLDKYNLYVALNRAVVGATLRVVTRASQPTLFHMKQVPTALSSSSPASSLSICFLLSSQHLQQPYPPEAFPTYHVPRYTFQKLSRSVHHILSLCFLELS